MKKKLIIALAIVFITSVAYAQWGGSGSWGDVINFLKRCATNIIPSVGSTYDLGSAAKPWDDIYGDNIHGGAGSNFLLLDCSNETGYSVLQTDKLVICSTFTSAGIQDCITALGAEGGEVYLPEGEYDITSNISVAIDNVTIRGSGWGTILKNNIWANWAGGADHTVTISGNYCTIRDLQINGNSANSGETKYLIYSTGATNNIVDCFLQYSDDRGMVLGVLNEARGNYVSNCDSSGIFLLGGGSLCIGNQTNGNAGGGIYADGSDCIVTENNLDSETQQGIYVDGLATTVSNNNIDSSTNDGIYVSASAVDCIIEGNRFYGIGNGYNDIKVLGDYNLISNNYCAAYAGSSERGIYLDEADHCIVVNNITNGHDTCGIQIDNDCDDTTVAGNSCTDTTPYVNNGTNGIWRTINNVIIDGLTANLGVYTDALKMLTSTPPTSGILGYWDRTGTVLSPATAGDDITTTGTLGAGAITGTSLTSSGLTSGRVVFTGASGLLSDDAYLLYDTSVQGLSLTATTPNTGGLTTVGLINATGVTGITASKVGSICSFTGGTGWPNGGTSTVPGVGGSIDLTGGVGGTNTYVSGYAGGDGGAVVLTGGQGGVTSYAGGDGGGVALYGGAGSVNSGGGSGGVGGAIVIAGGSAGAVTQNYGRGGGAFSASTGTGGSSTFSSTADGARGGGGGTGTFAGGSGGDATNTDSCTGTATGGSGGNFTFTAGGGGSATSVIAANKNATGGAGGSFTFSAGGGAMAVCGAATATGGAGGSLTFRGGGGHMGISSGGTDVLGQGGNITFQPGINQMADPAKFGDIIFSNPIGTEYARMVGADSGSFRLEYKVYIGANTAPTALLHLKAGTATAGTAPLKFTSGTLTTAAVAGQVEFLTDDFYGTITTGSARKKFVLDNGTNLVATRIPYVTTNGRLTDSANFTTDGTDWLFALDKKLTFGDSAVGIWSDDNGYLDGFADVGIRLTAPLTRVIGDLYVGNNADVDPVIVFDGDTSDGQISYNEENGYFEVDQEWRTSTSLYRRYYHLPVDSFNPGASGATWVSANANHRGGWQLNASTDTLEFGTDVHSDWDGATDLIIEFHFCANVGGNPNDTVDLKLQCFYNSDGDVATKTQTIEVPTTTDGTQFKVYTVIFTIEWDEVDNNVEAGDAIGFILNLETDTSEIDDIILLQGNSSYYYQTTHTGIESGDV